VALLCENVWSDQAAFWGGKWGWANQQYVRWGSRWPECKQQFWGICCPMVTMKFQSVHSEEMYSIHVRKVDKIYVCPISKWNPHSSGFLKMYFITTSKLGFPKNLLKSNRFSFCLIASSTWSSKKINNVIVFLVSFMDVCLDSFSCS